MDDRDSGVRRSRRWISIYLFGAVAAFLTFPNPAAASTLGSSGSAITYSAIAGEVNKLTVTQVGSNIVIAETGGVIITPSVPCVSLLPGTASCPVAGIRNISLTLQNMDDSASYDDSIGPPVTGVTIDAGVDNDTMAGEGLVPGFFIAREGNDVVTGTDAADDIRADVGDDTVVSGLGNDYIDEGPGADTMIAGPGNDRFAYEQPANGADVLDGGPGISDSVDARARTSDLSISINGIADDGDAAEGDNLIGIERIDTGSGNDTITCGPGPDLILANDGNDVLSGGAGPDFLGGGDGNDTANGSDGGDNIAGGNGGDTMDGGGADDEFSGEMFDDGTDTYTGGSGVDTISGIGDFIGRAVTVDLDGVADDGVIVPQEGVPLDNAGTDIENLVLDVPGEGSEEAFAATNDILVGNDSANLIDGGPGDDRINGLGGPDALLGGAGGDQLDGGSGTDD
ncbi:MAG: calcium-binding protein, partial [Solirubrobacterales bacterium]